MRLFVLVIASGLFAIACGPSAGAPCEKANELLCAGSTSLLACEGVTWTAYACPSCAGTTCNWKNAKSGDACPAASAGQGWCPFDGRKLACFFSASADAGVFVESACSACVQGKTIAEVGGCP